MEDDDDDGDDDDHHHYHDNDDEYDDHPQTPTKVVHQQPPATPQQPLQPPKPLFSPLPRPPSKKRSTPTATPSPRPQQPPPQVIVPPQQPPPQVIVQPQQPLQPPQPLFLPSSPPQKPRGPPQYRHNDDDDDDDNNDSRRQVICAVITTLLLLLGLTALILWLLYRPSKPQFTAISAAVFLLNTTSPPTFVITSFQITVLTRNPSKRTSFHYDRLTVAVHYRNHPITPPAPLPPLHQRKRSTVMMSPLVGGGAAVAVPPEVVEGLAADAAYGVVGLSWVLKGRVKYKAGLYKSGHNRVYVRCDVMVGFKNGDGSNLNSQVPLLGNPPCLVDV
ncbi:hypothetical protein SOVF_060890 [Spinacia oleracea]|nr:hypothetical protein SOVF_060890 [Spinacia oleracea]